VIAAGERRWLACREAGFETIDVIIDEGLSDPDRLLELALSESIQREELSRADVAAAFQKIKRQRRLSDEQLAQGYGKTVEWVRQTLAFGSRAPEGEDRLTIRPVSRRPAHRTGGRHLGGGLSDGSR
jgi:ParB/RepB/Spo0J family partition protein